jgi:Protein of unknown function (DUF2971)
MVDDFAPWPGLLGENGQLAYHYTSRAAAFEHILPERLLRLGSLATMRDPLENKERAEHLLAPASWPEEDVEKLRALERDALANTKILSLTVDRPPDPGVSAAHAWGYARPRMWEQYAENHAGVCLVFDRSHIHQQALVHLEAINSTAWGEVIYSDLPLVGYPNARTLNATTLTVRGDGDTARGYRAHLRQNAEELFFRKVEDWASERELRYVLLDDDDSAVAVPYERLRAVILGERFPSWQLPGAAALCQVANAALLKMAWGGVPTLTAPQP